MLWKLGECYLMTMARLLTLLIMFAFVCTNGPAVAMAICEHEDARAHAAALRSSEASVSLLAQSEETAAKTASTQGMLSDAATTLLAGYILPTEAYSFAPRFIDRVSRHAFNPAGLGSRSVPPLLEPPLA